MEIAFNSRELRDTCSEYLQLKEQFGESAQSIMIALEDLKACSSLKEFESISAQKIVTNSCMSSQKILIPVSSSIQLAFVMNNSYCKNIEIKNIDWNSITHLKLLEIKDNGV